MSALLAASGLHHAYGRKTVLDDVSLAISAGEFTAIIGPNGSGKSTLLRCLGRLLRPSAGTVRLGDEPIFAIDPKTFARRVAFVPQGPMAPPDLVVEELVWRGRFPHRGLFGRRLDHDRSMVERAMKLSDIAQLRGHAIGTLSGGERQRAFIALALAQEPSLLLLDEPTTFLDIAHQIDLLALLARLNRDEGLTVVAVMHDLGQAALFARRLVALRDGMMVADGDPRAVVTESRVRAIFGPGLRVTPDPLTGLPLVLPAALLAAPPPAVVAPSAAAEKPVPSAPSKQGASGRPKPRIGPRRRKPRSVVPAAKQPRIIAEALAVQAAAEVVVPPRKPRKPADESPAPSPASSVPAPDTAKMKPAASAKRKPGRAASALAMRPAGSAAVPAADATAPEELVQDQAVQPRAAPRSSRRKQPVQRDK